MPKEKTKTTEAPPLKWRDFVGVHPAADIFPLLPPDELAALAADIAKNGLREKPLILRNPYGTDDHEYLLIDGRNRLDALELNGETYENSKYGDTRGAWIHGVGNVVREENPKKVKAWITSLNIHRRHLTPEQKSEAVAALLTLDPSKSDRQIAKEARVDHKTVGKARREAEGRGDIPHTDTRTDSKGRKQPTKRKFVQDAGHESPEAAHRLRGPGLGCDYDHENGLPGDDAKELRASASTWQVGEALRLAEDFKLRKAEDPDEITDEILSRVEWVAHSWRELGFNLTTLKAKKPKNDATPLEGDILPPEKDFPPPKAKKAKKPKTINATAH